MAAVTYEAKRSVIPEHTAGNTYTLDVPLVSAARSTKPVTSSSVSLDGTRETLFLRNDVSYQCSTPPTDDVDIIEQMREFLDSVAGGESFDLDVFGDSVTPDNPVTVFLNGGYSETPQAGGFFIFSFSAIT